MPNASEEAWDGYQQVDTDEVTVVLIKLQIRYAHESGLNLKLTYINAADGEN